MQQGMRQGLEQSIQQTARNLLANGFDIETVSKNTGLNIERLQKLKEETTH